jgi:murein L,D-transpeptidase YafK
MTPRRSQILLAMATATAIGVGVVAWRVADRETEADSAPPPPAATTLDEGLGKRFLHALRGGLPPTSAPQAPATAPEPATTVAAPSPYEVANLPQETAQVETPPLDQLPEVDAPQPPRRPTNLALDDFPLPPRRPATLLAEQPPTAAPAQPEAQAPATQPQASPWAAWLSGGDPTSQAQQVVLVDAPQPPLRPAKLAALQAAALQASTPTAAPQPTAAPAGQQVAALAPETLKPAPPDSFDHTDQTPARFNMGAPVFVRIFKKEGELELWVKANKRYTLYRSFPICKWSGKLGPKLKEADYQSPEGFYAVSAKQLNPHSNYHLAFNVGYPNAFDKQNGRTGGLVMVHGNCKSVGCFAMTDKGVDEIYGFVSAAISAGQKEVPVHIFPFRMTESALEHETGGGFMSFLNNDGGGQRWNGFWRNLKEGYDRFEATHEPPVAYACGDHYSFDPAGGCQRIAGW